MKTDHIINQRKVGGDYFILIFRRASNKHLSEYLDKFNHEEYHILKTTGKQRLVTYDEMLEFKYSGYTFFRKDVYNIESILGWCSYIRKYTSNKPSYLSKPTPPYSPNEIIIKE
jgi:hypothetical protein